MNGHPRSAACVPVCVLQDGNVTRRTLLGLLCLLLILCVQVAAQERRAPPPGAFLFVIDRSGSMLKPGLEGNNRSRWDEMQSRATKFLEKVPLKSLVWLAVFEGNAMDVRPREFHLEAETDRAAALTYIREIKRPLRGNTALWDTRGIAFEYAEKLLAESPDRAVMVITYTDGENEPDPGAPSRYTPDSLKKRFSALVARGYQIEDYEVLLHKASGPVFPPAPIGTSPETVHLPPAHRPAEPEVEVRFHYWETLEDQIAGKPLKVRFEPAPGSAIQAGIEGAYVLGKDAVRVRLKITNRAQLNPQQEYFGRLVFEFPQIEGWHVVPQGKPEVGVHWHKAEKPQIKELRPADGTSFAMKREVNFHVAALQGADIEWNFGDNTPPAKGCDVAHTYDAPGQRAVRVSVKTPDGDVDATLALHIVDVTATLDAPPEGICTGQPARFTASGTGKIDRYDWRVDGTPVTGQDRDDGKSSHIDWTFNEPGQHSVRVVAIADTASDPTPPYLFKVHARPTITFMRPTPSWGRPAVAAAAPSSSGW